MWLEAIFVEEDGGSTADLVLTGDDLSEWSISAIHFFMSEVRWSGMLGFATNSKKTKNSPLVSAFEWVWQHNFHALARLVLCDKFLHKALTYPPSILLLSVLSLLHLTSNSLILVARGLYFYVMLWATEEARGCWAGFEGAYFFG